MPALPTLQVTATQAERLTAAFGSVAEYKAWLKNTLKEEVARREIRAAADPIRQDVYQDYESAT